MAKLKHMIGEKAISGFKGVLDFYYYMGVAVARKWPKSPGKLRSPAVQAQWQPFIEAAHLAALLSPGVREFYRLMTAGTHKTWKDVFFTSYMSGIWTIHSPYPAPVPGPNAPRWALLNYRFTSLDDAELICIDTSTPCHLWLRITHIEPQIHLEPALRRGLPMHYNPRYCLVAFHDIEQEELGDTPTHSWLVPSWLPNTWRWFYLHGSIGGLGSPSTSPVLDLQHLVPTYEERLFETWSA